MTRWNYWKKRKKWSCIKYSFLLLLLPEARIPTQDVIGINQRTTTTSNESVEVYVRTFSDSCATMENKSVPKRKTRKKWEGKEKKKRKRTQNTDQGKARQSYYRLSAISGSPWWVSAVFCQTSSLGQDTAASPRAPPPPSPPWTITGSNNTGHKDKDIDKGERRRQERRGGEERMAGGRNQAQTMHNIRNPRAGKGGKKWTRRGEH